MKRRSHFSYLPVLAIASAWLGASAPAAAQQAVQAPAPAPAATTTSGEEPANKRTTTFADILGSAGYSSAPAFGSNNGSSIFGRISLNAFHSWNDERGGTSITGYVEDTTYLRGGYGSPVIFRVAAQTQRKVSEKVSVFGGVGVSGDIGGQLSNRFTTPVGTPPGVVPPPEGNPEFINLSGRQYLVNGDAGASIVTSPLSSVSISAAASHAFFTGSNSALDYTTYQGSLGYTRQLSERTSGGVTVTVEHQEYRGGNYSNVVNPTLTLGTQLAPDIRLNGSVGLLAIYVHRAGANAHSYSPSFTASICKSGEKSQLCASASRTAQAPLAIESAQSSRSAAATTSFNLSYSRKLGEKETIRALVTATNSSRVDVLNQGQFRITYVTGLVSYDRKVGNRLYAGVSGGVRKVFQTGPDPRTDFNASLYLRYHLGDIL